MRVTCGDLGRGASALPTRPRLTRPPLAVCHTPGAGTFLALAFVEDILHLALVCLQRGSSRAGLGKGSSGLAALGGVGEHATPLDLID